MFALLKRYFLRRNPKGKYSSSTGSVEQTTAGLRIEQGNSLWEQEQNRQLTKTTASYRQAIQLSDNSAQAYQKLAEALRQEGKLEEAAFFYRQAIALNASAFGNKVSKASKGNQITVVNLSNPPLAPQSVNGNINDQPKTAMTQLKDLKFNGNGSGSSNYSQKPTVLPQLLKGSTNDRQTFLAKSSNLAPELPLVNGSTNNYQTLGLHFEAVQVYLQQAEAYCAQKKWEPAIAACKRALQIAPKMAEAYKIWGNALQRMGQAAEAMGYYAKALEIQPDLAEVHANLGSLYAQKQQWQRAIDYYQKAVAINPKFPGAYRNLAKVWTQVGQPQKATECTYQALTLEPGKASPEAHFDLGNELWQQSRFSEAIACYRRTIEFNPNFVEACQKLADALAQQGEWKESNTYYRKVLELNAAGAAISLDKQGEQRKQGGKGRENRANPNSTGLPQLRGEKKVQGLLKASAQEMKQLMAASEVALLPSQSKGATGINAHRDLEKPLDAQGKVEEAIQRYIKIAKAQPDSAEVHANLGSLYAQQQQWQQAIACYKKAIELNPKFPGAYRNLAKVLTRTGKRELAVQCWDRALALEPSWAKAEEHLNLGNTLLEQGKTEKALNCYRRAIQLKPSCSEAYQRLGEILTEQGQVQEAIALYRQAVERNPQNAESYYRLGQALAVQEKWDEAISCYQKATEVQPNLWQGYHQLGEALSKRQRWQEAVAAYRRAAELNPDFFWSHHKLGYALLQLERWEEAADSFRRDIKLNPDFYWSHYNLGDALSEQRNWDEAITAYRGALELQPDLPHAYQKLGDALRQGEKADLAAALDCYRQAIERDPENVQNYHKALEIQPNDLELYLKLGNVLKRKGRLDEAVVIYQMGLRIQPDNAELLLNLEKDFNASQETKRSLSTQAASGWEFYHDLGDQLQLQGKLDEAVAAYHKAIVRNPLHSWSYHNLGDTHLKLGQWNEAVVAYCRAIELNPSYFWSKHNLAVAHFNQGKWSEAIELCSRNIELHPDLNLPYYTLKDILLKQWNATFAEGDILLKQGNRDGASAIYRQAIQQYKESLHLPSISIPKEIPLQPSVILIVDDHLPQCLRYRVQQKIEQLEYAGISAQYFPWRDMAQAKNMLHFCHVVIFYRVPALPEIVETIEYTKAIKKVVFYEIDDLIFDEKEYPEPIESYGGQVTVEQYHGLIKGTTLFREAMALCDYAIASTPSLARRMERIIAKGICFVHRNALDKLNSEFLKLDIPKIERNYISIFYGSGTKAHNADFNQLAAPALAKILEKYPQVRLTLMGYLTLPEVLLPYKERIDRVDLISDVEIYWEFLRQADINIAVLNATPVNNCKSELKWFEAGCLGIPSVVSATQTYVEILTHGINALIASTPEEWFENLELLVTDANLRSAIAKAAYEKAWREYDIPVMANNIKKIIMTGIEEAAKEKILVPRSDKKKLLIVNVFYHPQSIGGATRVVKDQVDILKANYSDQYKISVFTTDDGNPNPYQISEYTYEGVYVTKVSTPAMVGMDWQYKNPKMYDIFSQYLKFNQPNLIHFHCIQRLTGSVLEAAADLNIPYLVTVHDAWWISDHQFLVNSQGVECDYQQNDPLVTAGDTDDISGSLRRKCYLRQCLNRANAVLAVSEAFTGLYRRNGFPQTRVNRNGIMPKQVLPRKLSPSKRVRLAHVGGISAHKGYDLLQKAINATKLSNTELTVVDHAQLSGSVRQEKWGNTPVTFIGKVPQEKMPEFYSTIDVLMAPSIWPESFGLVTREAAAAGVWVVASNKGAIAEDLVPGINGDVFNPDNFDELVEILERIDREPQPYQQLVSADVHVRVTEEQVKEMEVIYQSILGLQSDKIGSPEMVES